MYIAYCFLLHFIADFLLQSREMGQKKSTDTNYLGMHIGIIWVVFMIGTGDLVFATLNALIHACIDAVIWKGYAYSVWKRRRQIAIDNGWNEKSEVFSQLSEGESKAYLKRNFKYWEDHWFYSTIGLDQFLHAITIVLLLEIL